MIQIEYVQVKFSKCDANLTGCSSISCAWLFKLNNFIGNSGLRSTLHIPHCQYMKTFQAKSEPGSRTLYRLVRGSVQRPGTNSITSLVTLLYILYSERKRPKKYIIFLKIKNVYFLHQAADWIYVDGINILVSVRPRCK